MGTCRYTGASGISLMQNIEHHVTSFSFPSGRLEQHIFIYTRDSYADYKNPLTRFSTFCLTLSLLTYYNNEGKLKGNGRKQLLWEGTKMVNYGTETEKISFIYLKLKFPPRPAFMPAFNFRLRIKTYCLVFLLLCAVTYLPTFAYTPPASNRAIVNLDSTWKFNLADVSGAQNVSFNDAAWTLDKSPAYLEQP